MKIKSGFVLREVCGEHVVVAQGIENIDFNSVIAMNETAACIWKSVVGKDEFTLEDMVAAVMAEYEVDENTALDDCKTLATQWVDAGIAIA